MTNAIISETTQKSRKEYTCRECCQPIKRGSEYLRLVQKWEGEIVTDRSHVDCTKFAHELCGSYRELIETWEGRDWLWDAMAEGHDRMWEILHLSKKHPDVRKRLVQTMWSARQRSNEVYAALQAARTQRTNP
ncbi:MAG: hypothetical protein COA69_00040 [Robiginitomaculum sp.]|nr:MAG: hypothetical protein COA69_00040 [Robiginitomaculum sp.]